MGLIKAVGYAIIAGAVAYSVTEYRMNTFKQELPTQQTLDTRISAAIESQVKNLDSPEFHAFELWRKAQEDPKAVEKALDQIQQYIQQK